MPTTQSDRSKWSRKHVRENLPPEPGGGMVAANEKWAALMWAAGVTSSAIAGALAVTRNVVIGRATRRAWQRSEDVKPTPVKHPCQYPLGNPLKPGFSFCGEPTYSSRLPYCEKHANLCYTNWSEVKVYYDEKNTPANAA